MDLGLFKKSKDALIATLIASFLSTPAFSFTAGVSLNDRIRNIEVDESRKIIQLQADNSQTEGMLSRTALVMHEKENLEIKAHELSYEMYNICKKTISQSKDLSSKIKSAGDLFNSNLKIPWGYIAAQSADAKIFALADSQQILFSINDYINESSLSFKKAENLDFSRLNILYNRLQALGIVAENSTELLKYVQKSNEIKTILTQEEISNLKSQVHYYDLKAIEKLGREVIERFKKTESFNNYSKKEKKFYPRNLDDVIQGFSVINSPPKQLLSKEIVVKTYSGATIDNPLTKKVDLHIDKVLEDKRGYVLKFSIMLSDYDQELLPSEKFFLNLTGNNLVIFYPKNSEIGKIEESVYALKSKNNLESKIQLNLAEKIGGELKEVFAFGEDKKITRGIEINEMAFKSLISLVFKRNVTRASNSSSWLLGKIINFDEKTRQEQQDSILNELSENYQAKEIPFYPSNSLFSAQFVSIPIEYSDSSEKINEKDVYIFLRNGSIKTWNIDGQMSGDYSPIFIKIEAEKADKVDENEDSIPESWKRKIILLCAKSLKVSESDFAKSMKESESLWKNIYDNIKNDAPKIFASLNLPNDTSHTGYYNDRICSKNPKFMEGLDRGVKQIRRKSYGWILSQNNIRDIDENRIYLANSFQSIDFSDKIPSEAVSIFEKKMVDSEFLSKVPFEKIGQSYCNFLIDTESLECYFPVLFDNKTTHIEFSDNTASLDSERYLKLKNVYLQTEIKLDDKFNFVFK